MTEPKKKTAAEKAAEKGFSTEPPTGYREQHSEMRLPEGAPYLQLIENGAYREGTEEFAPYSVGERWAFHNWKMSAKSEEYVYYFDDDVIVYDAWKEEEGTASAQNRTDCSSYTAFMEAFGEDGWIVIGRPVGPREGHLAYFGEDTELYSNAGLTGGYTLTDFAIEKVLFGPALPETIRIREEYLFGTYMDQKNVLLQRGASGRYALKNDFYSLLFIKKSEEQEVYDIFGNSGGLTLTGDYENYDQEYLDHLARFLNRVPEEYGAYFKGVYGDKDYYAEARLENQTGRSLKEALKANKDDLIVALAQKYQIRIWPQYSKVFEEEGFPTSIMAYEGCLPDDKKAK